MVKMVKDLLMVVKMVRDLPMVVKMVREYMRELEKVQTLTPGSLPVCPSFTLTTTDSWNLDNKVLSA